MVFLLILNGLIFYLSAPLWPAVPQGEHSGKQKSPVFPDFSPEKTGAIKAIAVPLCFGPLLWEGPSLGSCHCPHDVTVEPGAAYSHGGGVRCAATERYFIRPTHHCLAASGNSLQILGRVTFFRSSPVIYDGCTL